MFCVLGSVFLLCVLITQLILCLMGSVLLLRVLCTVAVSVWYVLCRTCTSLQIKHEQKSQLEKIKDTPLVVEMALPSSLTLDVYGCLKEALSCGSKLSSLKMKPGELQPLYIMAAPEDKYVYVSATAYHRARNIGNIFNLVVWWSCRVKIAKFLSTGQLLCSVLAVQPPSLISANIRLQPDLAQIIKSNDRQYFQMYGRWKAHVCVNDSPNVYTFAVCTYLYLIYILYIHTWRDGLT